MDLGLACRSFGVQSLTGILIVSKFAGAIVAAGALIALSGCGVLGGYEGRQANSWVTRAGLGGYILSMYEPGGQNQSSAVTELKTGILIVRRAPPRGPASSVQS